MPPVIILGPLEIDVQRAAAVRRLARQSAVVYAPSMDRLLEETVLLLHRSEVLAAPQRDILATVRQVDPMLSRRKVLVVDDDLRNIFDYQCV